MKQEQWELVVRFMLAVIHRLNRPNSNTSGSPALELELRELVDKHLMAKSKQDKP